MVINKNKAILKLGYSCNNNCLFCHAKPKKKFGNLNYKQITNKIDKLKNKNIGTIIFSGGEPTIRKDMFLLMDYSIKQNFSVGLITNGRMLSNKVFLEKLCTKRLKWCYISLQGEKKETHNKITQTNSFEQTIRGIKNVINSNIELKVNFVVNKYNVTELKSVVNLSKKLKIKKIKFSLMEPIRDTNSEKIKPSLLIATEKTKEAIQYAKELGMDVGFDGFPSCLMEGFESHLDNLKTNKIKFISEVWENDFYESDEGEKIKIKKCDICPKKDICEGIYPQYSSELK